MRAAAASVARAVRLRKQVSRRDVAGSVWSRKQTSWREVARASSNAQQASTSHPAGVVPIPIARKHPADGPSYVVDDAGAVIRFLAFHGCGSRFTILYKRGEDSAEFDAAELELDCSLDEGAPRQSWRLRTASGFAANLRAFDPLDGDAVKRLALYDDDLSSKRLYSAADSRWSARTAVPRWPAPTLDALDAGGGLLGADALVCVDGGYWIDVVRLGAFPTPVLFPHGAWRLEHLGPGAPDFHALADLARGVDAASALEAAVAGGEESDAPGRLTADGSGLGRGAARVSLGDVFGESRAINALDAARDRTYDVTFYDDEPSRASPLGLTLAPLDWVRSSGAIAWEVDEGSAAEIAGVGEGHAVVSVDGRDVSGMSFEDIDAMFDRPPGDLRPINVTFNSKQPGMERLYAVEMRAEDVARGLAKTRASSSGEDFREPGDVLDDMAAVTWRETPATIFFGDPGSVTPAHHDIVGQIELCHVLSGQKILGIAPRGDDSDALLDLAREEDEEEESEEDEEYVPGGETVGVPAHRDLDERELEMLESPRLSLVAARPGDVVAFSSAATHFAVNGVDEPCAAVFHGFLTPASARVLASYGDRLDPFSGREVEEEGFGGHLTGREALSAATPKGGFLRGVLPLDVPGLGRSEIGANAADEGERILTEVAKAADEANEAIKEGRRVEKWIGEERTTFFVQ